jgi:hypothetical protein
MALEIMNIHFKFQPSVTLTSIFYFLYELNTFYVKLHILIFEPHVRSEFFLKVLTMFLISANQ